MHPLALSAAPFAPIISPLGQEGEIAPGPTASQLAIAKTTATWGMIGVTTAALLSAGLTAAAFASYRKTDSVLLPALVSGLGSLTMGGALLYILVKSTTGTVNPKMIYAAAGAQLAA